MADVRSIPQLIEALKSVWADLDYWLNVEGAVLKQEELDAFWKETADINRILNDFVVVD
jgi:hypothetical protein